MRRTAAPADAVARANGGGSDGVGCVDRGTRGHGELSRAAKAVTVVPMTSPTEPPAAPRPPEPEDDQEHGLLLPDGTTVGSDGDGGIHGDGDGSTRADGVAHRSPYSPMRVIARVPVRRITKVQAIALVIFTLLSLGPILALVVVLRSDTGTVPIVVTEPPITAQDGLNLSLTVMSVNAVTREMAVRMTIKSSSQGPTGLVEGGRMTDTVDIGLPAAPGSLQGDSTVSLEEGSTVGAIEFMVQLTNGSVARYPYDTYQSEMLIIASREADPDQRTSATGTTGTGTGTGTGSGTGTGAGTGEPGSGTTDRVPVPISVEVSADVPGFILDGSLPSEQATSTRLLDLEVRRNGPTLVYTTWIMILWWALSVSAVFILWSVAIWRSSTPPWAYGYLVGVLFALAPLRGALPGQPPYGVLIDYVSFYWAVGTMGLGLILLVSFFVRDARQDGRSRTREEEELEDRTADVAYDAGNVVVATSLPVPVGAEPVVAVEPGTGSDAARSPKPDQGA